ncbi:hypothetical protein BVRB_037480, partial [Beta vulgaris subsp. vulgaris]
RQHHTRRAHRRVGNTGGFRDRYGGLDSLRGRWPRRHDGARSENRADAAEEQKDVLLVVNKADFNEDKIDLAEAYRLGLGEPVRVSAEHGANEGVLRDAILTKLGPIPPEDLPDRSAEKPLCVCFIGRPNVGKSSLSNRLLDSDRLIVSDVPGTTRDSVSLDFQFKGRDGEMYP